MEWKCPFAKQSEFFENRLQCVKEIKDNVNYGEPTNFIGSMCLYQKFCNCKSVYLNTEQAKLCYEMKSKKN